MQADSLFVRSILKRRKGIHTHMLSAVREGSPRRRRIVSTHFCNRLRTMDLSWSEGHDRHWEVLVRSVGLASNTRAKWSVFVF
jgi:hypothetical protein